MNHVVKQWYKYLESLDALGSDLGPTHGGQVGRLRSPVPRRAAVADIGRASVADIGLGPVSAVTAAS